MTFSKKSFILPYLFAALLTVSCNPSGGIVESLNLTITDSGNKPGKWSSGSEIRANVIKGGSPVAEEARATVISAAEGTISLNLKNIERTEHTLVLWSPSKLVIPAGQSASTQQMRVGSTTFVPKKETLDIAADIAPVTAKVTVNVSSESLDYSGWNLENVSLTGPSAICGTLALQGSQIKIIDNESNTVLYEIASPSSLRTKAHTVVFHILPALGKDNQATLSYSLEKDGKRVEISHNFKFPAATSKGSEVVIDDKIPANIEGDWSAQGSGVKYKSVFPGKEWETTTPESRGYSSTKLEALRKEVEKLPTTSLMIAVGGKVIFSYGDVKENVRIASCRKSLLSTLYGKYVENGTINLNLSLKDLGIDEAPDSWGGSAVNWDGGSLLESEKEATIRDLLTARSGVFHKPANSGDDHSYMSASDRGKYKHGTYYLYNNWDFNCAGGVFEQLTGKNIYAAFKSDIADPCGWQDYDLSIQHKTEEYEGASRFLAYHFWISTRDMLRMALLMRNKGNWDGNQVVSESWVDTITTTFTKRADMHPSYRLTREFEYGWLWWTFCPQFNGYDASIFEGGFTATGSGGQYMTVLPALDMVIAHKDKTQNTEKSDYYILIKKIAACKE